MPTIARALLMVALGGLLALQVVRAAAVAGDSSGALASAIVAIAPAVLVDGAMAEIVCSRRSRPSADASDSWPSRRGCAQGPAGPGTVLDPGCTGAGPAESKPSRATVRRCPSSGSAFGGGPLFPCRSLSSQRPDQSGPGRGCSAIQHLPPGHGRVRTSARDLCADAGRCTATAPLVSLFAAT